MTEIIYGDYRMEHDVIATDRFNLYKKENRKITTQGVADKYKMSIGDTSPDKTEKVMAYALSLTNALERIASDIMADKNKSYDLAGYIREYTSVVRSIKTAVEVK